jgi:hypothetical protein
MAAFGRVVEDCVGDADDRRVDAGDVPILPTVAEDDTALGALGLFNAWAGDCC